MRSLSIIAMASLTLLAACGSDDDGGDDHAGEDVDAEGCEHLTEGPYVSIAAATDNATTAPPVASDHKAYSIGLPSGAPGYATLAVAAAGDVVFFVDQDVPFKVYSSSGVEEPLEDSATSVDACVEVKGRHVAELTVGTHVLEIGPATGVSLVNLVVEAGE
jgi:hypothetical protein